VYGARAGRAGQAMGDELDGTKLGFLSYSIIEDGA
jgi:hypothetical protein